MTAHVRREQHGTSKRGKSTPVDMKIPHIHVPGTALIVFAALPLVMEVD